MEQGSVRSELVAFSCGLLLSICRNRNEECECQGLSIPLSTKYREIMESFLVYKDQEIDIESPCVPRGRRIVICMLLTLVNSWEGDIYIDENTEQENTNCEEMRTLRSWLCS